MYEKEMFHNYLNVLSFTSANLNPSPSCLYVSICFVLPFVRTILVFLGKVSEKKLINMPIWIFVKEPMTIATNPSQLNSYPQFISMSCNF